MAEQFNISNKNPSCSSCSTIPGVGSATAQKLMKAFGSTKRISLATEEALTEIAGKAAARRVIEHYRGAGAVAAENA